MKTTIFWDMTPCSLAAIWAISTKQHEFFFETTRSYIPTGSNPWTYVLEGTSVSGMTQCRLVNSYIGTSEKLGWRRGKFLRNVCNRLPIDMASLPEDFNTAIRKSKINDSCKDIFDSHVEYTSMYTAVQQTHYVVTGLYPYCCDSISKAINPLNAEWNPICCLLALLGAHHFLHVSRIRVKSLTLRLLMSYIYGAPILDVSRSHTTTHHSR